MRCKSIIPILDCKTCYPKWYMRQSDFVTQMSLVNMALYVTANILLLFVQVILAFLYKNRLNNFEYLAFIIRSCHA